MLFRRVVVTTADQRRFDSLRRRGSSCLSTSRHHDIEQVTMTELGHPLGQLVVTLQRCVPNPPTAPGTKYMSSKRSRRMISQIARRDRELANHTRWHMCPEKRIEQQHRTDREPAFGKQGRRHNRDQTTV